MMGKFFKLFFLQKPIVVTFDTSTNFFSNVVPTALKIMEKFLNNKKITSEDGIQLLNLTDSINRFETQTRKIFVCDICEMEIHGLNAWNNHIAGKKHKWKLKKSKLEKNRNDSSDVINI